MKSTVAHASPARKRGNTSPTSQREAQQKASQLQVKLEAGDELLLQELATTPNQYYYTPSTRLGKWLNYED